jgi:hypothetical protein
VLEDLLRGAEHASAPVTGAAREAAAEELAAWLRTRLPEIEAHFAPSARAETHGRLQTLAAERAAARQAWWTARERAGR